jgi:hypothetical protein
MVPNCSEGFAGRNRRPLAPITDSKEVKPAFGHDDGRAHLPHPSLVEIKVNWGFERRPLIGSLSDRARRDMAGIVSTRHITFGLVPANLLKPSASEETGCRTGLPTA